MRVEIRESNESDWQKIKDAALFTIHKDNGKYPTEEWMERILMSEHSPIRVGGYIIRAYDVPSFVIGHIVRHNQGLIPFVSSLREDRCEYDEIPNRETPNNFMFYLNYQAAIYVSRKRYCNCASEETRDFWKLVKDEIRKINKPLAKSMVRECVYRNGLCPEMYTCGFNHTKQFDKELEEYTKGFESQISRKNK